MIHSIVSGISVALNREFGDGCRIYAEEVKQGLEEPCFFISCLRPAYRSLCKNRYFRENLFSVQYFPAEVGREREECHEVAERLFSCLEWICVGGVPVRGTKRNIEFTDGVLNFFVNYDLLVRREEKPERMEEIAEEVSVKNGKS